MSFAVPKSAVFTGHNFSLQIDVAMSSTAPASAVDGEPALLSVLTNLLCQAVLGTKCRIWRFNLCLFICKCHCVEVTGPS